MEQKLQLFGLERVVDAAPMAEQSEDLGGAIRARRGRTRYRM
ncbi:hypothetical protein [Rhodococcus sp. AW25M09]|nr:hypothetical protein [Rhodococcus sp. AW25M09]